MRLGPSYIRLVQSPLAGIKKNGMLITKHAAKTKL